MSALKICLLAPEFLPNWGGVGTYCIELAKAIAGKVELHVATVERTKNRKAIYSKRDMERFFGDAITALALVMIPFFIMHECRRLFFRNFHQSLKIIK